MRNFVFRGLGWFLLVWMAAVLVGCLVGTERLLEVDRLTHISRLTNTPSRDAPPIPLLAELTLQDYEISLRRVIIRYTPRFSLTESEPKPLFTGDHLQILAKALKKHLPTLEEDQRIQFQFLEPYNDLGVVTEIYGDGEYLVFDFKVLSRTLEDSPTRNLDHFDRARIVKQAGQVVETSHLRTVLREPVRRDQVAAAGLLQEKLDVIGKALQDEVVDEDEAERLIAIVRSNSGITVTQLEAYMEKRGTLEAALKQELFSQTEYDGRKQKLIEEMEQQ